MAEQQEVNVGSLESESCRNNVTQVDQVQTLGTSSGSTLDHRLCSDWLKGQFTEGKPELKASQMFYFLNSANAPNCFQQTDDRIKRKENRF